MIKAAELLFKAAEARQADRPAADRPQRAGRPDAQEPRGAGPGQRRARRQHRRAEQAAQEGRTTAASSSRRSTSSATCRRTSTRGTNIFVLIDEAHRTTGGDLGNYLMAGLPNAMLHRLHRHAGGQDRVRQGNVQDLRLRGRQGLPAQVLDRARASRTARRCRSTTTSRRTRCSCRTSSWRRSSRRARRDRGHHRHRGAEQDPRPRGEPEELPQGRRARGQDRAVRGRPLPRERRAAGLQGVSRRRGPARRAPSTRRRSTSILPPEYSEVVYTGNNNDPPHLKKWHLDEKKEKQIRKDFAKAGELPEDPDRHREAAHRLRRAGPLRDVPRQADARPHAAAGDRAREPALRERGGRRW